MPQITLIDDDDLKHWDIRQQFKINKAFSEYQWLHDHYPDAYITQCTVGGNVEFWHSVYDWRPFVGVFTKDHRFLYYYQPSIN